MREGMDIAREVARAEGVMVDFDFRKGMVVAVFFRVEASRTIEGPRVQIHGTPRSLEQELLRLRLKMGKRLEAWRKTREKNHG